MSHQHTEHLEHTEHTEHIEHTEHTEHTKDVGTLITNAQKELDDLHEDIKYWLSDTTQQNPWRNPVNATTGIHDCLTSWDNWISNIESDLKKLKKQWRIHENTDEEHVSNLHEEQSKSRHLIDELESHLAAKDREIADLMHKPKTEFDPLARLTIHANQIIKENQGLNTQVGALKAEIKELRAELALCKEHHQPQLVHKRKPSHPEHEHGESSAKQQKQ